MRTCISTASYSFTVCGNPPMFGVSTSSAINFVVLFRKTCRSVWVSYFLSDQGEGGGVPPLSPYVGPVDSDCDLRSRENALTPRTCPTCRPFYVAHYKMVPNAVTLTLLAFPDRCCLSFRSMLFIVFALPLSRPGYIKKGACFLGLGRDFIGDKASLKVGFKC